MRDMYILFFRSMNQVFSSAVFVGVCAALGALMGWGVSMQQNTEAYYETVLFSTVLSSDDISSVEEKETASHFFAEALLGWTLSPAFTNQLGFPITSRKQERANVIFQFTSASQDESAQRLEIFSDTLRNKLNMYNTQAKTQFSVLFDAPVTEEKRAKKSFWTVGGMAGGFFLGLVVLEGWRLLRRKA